MFSLLKIKLKNVVKTKRGIALKLRRDSRDSVRHYKELAEYPPKTKKVIDSGVVEDVITSFDDWIKFFKKGMNYVLNGEEEIVAEEQATFNETTDEETLINNLEKSLEKSKLNDKIKQKMKTKLKLVYRRFKDVHTFELSELRKEFQSVHSELKDEEHLRDFNFSVNETQHFNDVAWHLKGDIKDIEKLTSALRELENKDTKYFDEIVENDAKLLKELEKDEENLINQGEKLIKMISNIMNEYVFMMRVFVHYYFLYYKHFLLIKKARSILEENGFPDENLKTISAWVKKEDKTINDHTELIFNAIRRLARLQE